MSMSRPGTARDGSTSRQWRALLHSSSLAKRDPLIASYFGKILAIAVGPKHRNGINAIGGSKTEMGDVIAAALVTVGRIDEAHPTATAGPNRDFGADRVAIELRIAGVARTGPGGRNA